jgi:hypothetical protein
MDRVRKPGRCGNNRHGPSSEAVRSGSASSQPSANMQYRLQVLGRRRRVDLTRQHVNARVRSRVIRPSSEVPDERRRPRGSVGLSPAPQRTTRLDIQLEHVVSQLSALWLEHRAELAPACDYALSAVRGAQPHGRRVVPLPIARRPAVRRQRVARRHRCARRTAPPTSLAVDESNDYQADEC